MRTKSIIQCLNQIVNSVRIRPFILALLMVLFISKDVFAESQGFDPIFFNLNDIDYYDAGKDCEGNSPTGDSVSSDGASDSDWTKPGTQSYETAKKVFTAWVDLGLSGAAAAGIVGWVNSEGGFGMIGRAEGYYGTNDPHKASLKYGVVPVPSGNYSVGGGGIYQFTPYTKYAPLGSDDWENAEKMNAFVGKQVANGDWIPKYDLTGGNHSFRQMASWTNPEEASLMWNAYERGAEYLYPKIKPLKQADARKAYEVFQGEKYKFNEEKFNKNFGSKTGGDGDDSSNTSSYNECMDNSGGGSGAWAKNGTGTVSYAAFNAWHPDEVPADLKKYALDPKSVGLSWQSSAGWEAASGLSLDQCTALSAALMNKLWAKDGQHPVQIQGDGAYVAGNWASKFGGSTSNKPVAGAVFSQTPASAGGVHGHTGVVSHVFENGDILIVEQNFTPYSGQTGTGPTTWNYRYVTKSQIDGGFSFYSPANAGYKIVNEGKSL